MNVNARTLAGVENCNSRKQKSRIVRHSNTHTLCSLEDKTSINFYALLKLFARDG